MTARPDLLLVSLGTTLGWRVADRVFLAQAERAGASTALVTVAMGATGRLRRGYPVNDLVEAVACRRAAAAAVRRHRPRAVVLSTTTAAMLAPPMEVPYAVRLDAPARMNRPGLASSVLRPLERRGLGRAHLVLPWSRAAAAELPRGAAPAVVLPPPVAPSGRVGDERVELAVSYVPDPKAKGLDLLCSAWGAAGLGTARLAVFGIEPERARAFLGRRGIPEPAGVEWRGIAPPGEFRTALRSARAYVGSARWEDFGQAPLEALADGALLVTVPSGGPFEALGMARRLEPRLVAEQIDSGALAQAIGQAFRTDPGRARDYRRSAAQLLAPYRPEAVQATVEQDVLPALLGGRRAGTG